ncbi:glycosyltransferase involved in cell wall biosynthesis [Halomonas fontilapidosi]|uniref:Glycosyltransferase involved in cell wall biosynthesis n=1 Tax=Halomonas fontilapidosi TaxID=616675 RepID=A0A7W5GXK3_9GAMM|nr:glycosyltransferase family 4 protein [Halomonas fontilapidosi]MBB3182479.1 glycosyltransferase involved in cell wall biosynthesis [Halomonas fontilapidosi]
MDLGKVNSQPVVVTAITSHVSAVLIRGQLKYIKDNNFLPVLVSSPGQSVRDLAAVEGVQLYEIPMEREPSLFKDIGSLFRLIMLFIRLRPAIVNAGTPKAGFLCMIASFVCRVPGRVYTIRGFRHESLSGVRCWLMKCCEKLSCTLSNKVVCISSSVALQGLNEKILKEESYQLNGIGSSNGLNLDRFDPTRTDLTPVNKIKENIGFKNDNFIIGFVGRIVDRKGVDELVDAFLRLNSQYPHTRLLLIGPYEAEQSVSDVTLDRIESHVNITRLGFVEDVENYYRIMDLFVLPAHWEGFGNVLIEAAAMEVPVIACNVNGTKDAVSDGFNGMLVPPKDVDALHDAIRSYILDGELRYEHGRNGRLWAQKFSNVLIWEDLLKLYRSLLTIKNA